MSPQAIGNLYDALHTFERRHGRHGLYPVHKRLRFDEPPDQDIYDWIVGSLDLQGTARILDAGCGVGFGTRRLAELTGAHVTGISLSGREIERAADLASVGLLAGRVEFRQLSFEQLPPRSFDVIVAVESLKHARDLQPSLRALTDALTPRGQLVIVEDLFAGADDDPSAQQVTADWLLTRLYRASDYGDVLGGDCRIVDLSAHVRVAARPALLAKSAAVAVALTLAREPERAALRAFRGGLHLERLYATGAMTYGAIFYRKPARP